jgi:hypothetical protein
MKADTVHLTAHSGEQCAGVAPRTLTLPLKAEFFEAIKDGSKTEEFRLATDYWATRLVGRTYDRIVLTKGYPARDDHARRLERPWRGYESKSITHSFFGPKPVHVYAIKVN